MDEKFLTNQKFCRKGNVSGEEAKKRYQDRIASHASKPKPVKL